MAPVLEYDHVSMQPAWPYNTGLEDFSLRLNPGDLDLVWLDSGKDGSLIADLAQGLLIPAGGTVRFLEQSWTTLSGVQINERRRLIGRVFQTHGWLSNLDIDENILLGPCHHGTSSLAQLRRQADALARRLGLDGLPQRRPSLLSPHERRLAQWVRALLGEKRLLILENPVHDVYAQGLAKLAAALDASRAGGTAILWISSESDRAEFERMYITATDEYHL